MLPHRELRATIAVAAGSLFEAAPLLMFATALPPRFRGIAGALGCGCGSAGVPGALAPVAIATCWFAFGPLVTAARVAGALAASVAVRATVSAFVMRRFGAPNAPRFRGRSVGSCRPGFKSPSEHADGLEPFGELAAIGLCAAAAAPVAAFAAGAPSPIRVALGLGLGVLAPCATAGVALAAGAAHHAPELAAAILFTSGIAPRSWPKRLRARFELPSLVGGEADRPRPRAGGNRPPDDEGAATGCGVHANPVRCEKDGRFATGLLVVALLALCWRGPAGLVNPRLVTFAGAGALAAALYAWRGPRAPADGWLVPGVMLLALAAGSPLPSYAANETTAAGGFAGESVDFSGVSPGSSDERPPRLVRFAITCCRLDAEALEMPLDRALPVRAGSWVAAHGRLAERNGSLILRVESWHAIPSPADPFVYR